MSALGRSHPDGPAGPGRIVDCYRDLLPEGVRSHRGFGDVSDYLHGLDPDVAAFPYFIEWNLRGGNIDLTFTFPTRFTRRLRVPFWDLATRLGRGAGETGRGRRLVEGMSERLRSLPLDAPIFPRAVSISLGALAAGAREVGVDLVFADFGPSLDLGSATGAMRRAFELIAEASLLDDEALRIMDRLGAGLRLAHVGAGWRDDRRLHKAYLGGRLDELVRAVVDRGGAPLLETRARDLDRLANATGSRPAHLVVDVTDGALARVGFELNFHLDGSEGFAEIAVADPLWVDVLPDELRRDAERLVEHGTLFRRLDDGSRARFRVSHLKVSFDGSGVPEWKAYLCFQRTISD
jgi:hypothetical protein